VSTIQRLAQRLDEADSVNDPFIGEATAEEMRKESELWPENPRWTRIEATGVTEIPPRRIEEYRFFDDDHPQGLPVVVVFEASVDRIAARIYSDHHLVPDRPPVIPAVEGLKPDLPEGDVLHDYFKSLPDPDPEATVSLFEAAGYIQHSNGRRFTGRAELTEDFTHMKRDSGGGISLRYARIGDDGKTLVLECFMPSGRPAVAIYERGAGHRVRAVRISL
jgi:hypothetical protein